jgi:hypothetical protein
MAYFAIRSRAGVPIGRSWFFKKSAAIVAAKAAAKRRQENVSVHVEGCVSIWDCGLKLGVAEPGCSKKSPAKYVAFGVSERFDEEGNLK